jgi:hypothetical protein
LIPCEEKDRFILFILEIGSLKKIVERIIEGGGIILEAGVILLNDDGKREGLGEEVLIDLRYPYLI